MTHQSFSAPRQPGRRPSRRRRWLVAALLAGSAAVFALFAAQASAAPLPSRRASVSGLAPAAPDDLADGAITAKVKSRLALDERIRSRDIRVATKDAVVTLSGSVASEGERDTAVKLARETEGVTSVVDRLEVKK